MVFMGLFKYCYGLRKVVVNIRNISNVEYDWRMGLYMGIDIGNLVNGVIDFRMDN